MNTLLEDSEQMPFHTDLALVFRALNGRQRDFTWILTECEINILDIEPRPEVFCGPRDDPVLLSGPALTELSTRDMQVIWGVLSGFRPDRVPELATLDPYPSADGNGALWRPGVTIQHPLAEIEIVCFDSSATLLLCRDDDLSLQFRAFFPEAVDLDEHNARRTG